jgi:hypothetical protein
MTLGDETFSCWGTTLLLGAGITVAALVLFPAVVSVLRPVAKALIEGSVALRASLQAAIAEGKEQFGDLVAEVKAECVAAANGVATAAE